MGGKRSQALAGDRSSGVSRSLGRVAREGPAPWLVRRETITVCLLERPPGNGGGRPTVHAPTVTRRLLQMWGLMWLQSMFPASVHAAGAARGLQRGGDSWRGGWGASRPPRQRGAAPGGEPGTRALGRPLEVPGGEATGGGTGGRARLPRSPPAPLGPSGSLHAGTSPPRRQLLSDEEARRAASGLAWRGSPRVAPSAPRRSPAKLTRVSFSN